MKTLLSDSQSSPFMTKPSRKYEKNKNIMQSDWQETKRFLYALPDCH